MEFSLSCLPDDTIRVSGFCGEDSGVVKLNAVSPVDTILHYGLLIQIFRTDMKLMLLQSDIQRMSHHTVCCVLPVSSALGPWPVGGR
jgi:hypothetical protein